MAFNLSLNSSNVFGANNSSFQYKFIAGNFRANDMEMCVSAATIPYSFFNLTSNYNNLSFTFGWPTTAGVWSSTTLTFPEGFYTATDLNNYIQQFCITNGFYLINGSGQNVFYFTLLPNTSAYAIQAIFYPVPTSLPPGYSPAPSNFAGYPTGARYTPRMTILSTNNFGTVIGFSAATYPAAGVNPLGVGVASYSLNSNILPPVGSTVNALVLRCNIINNPVTMPSDILDVLPINSTFGSNITYDPSFEKWVRVADGTYSSFVINIVDQNFNTVYANDPNVSITLLLRKRKL
jgi:hypothetical protein